MISQLINADIVTTQPDNGLTLTDSFRTDWRRRIDQVAEDPTTYLGLVVEADSESLVVDHGEDSITVRDGSE